MTRFLYVVFVLASLQSYGAAKDSTTKEYQYLILFKDKKFNYQDNKNASAYLSKDALQRRERLGIAIDSLDYPVSSLYIDNILKEGIKIRYATKWLNGVVIGVDEHEKANRQKLKFYVEKVVYLGIIERENLKLKRQTEELSATFSEGDQTPHTTVLRNKGYGESYAQNDMINAIKLHEMGLKGEGVNVAVFDAGFLKADKLSTFKPLFDKGKIKFTLDLIDDEINVYDDDDHGLHVFSCMAANTPNKMIGTAPEANYFLFRTEMGAKEYLIEELNWIRAAEMADSMGIDLINSSLGYTTFDDPKMNHTHADLDGKTTFISKGAAIAASRGILVVNSAGNDGNDPWKKIGVPADVETILSVGAVGANNLIAPFSSQGPTINGKLKPDLCAMGYYTTVASTYGSFYPGNGTSYSSPILCGGIACMYQASKNVSPAQMINALKMSASHAHMPDTFYGYGVPDLYLALTIAGINKTFDYKKKQVVYEIPDTTYGNLSVHTYGLHDQTGHIKIVKKKRFFFFFKRNKTIFNETMTFRTDGFNTSNFDLNKVKNRGVFEIVIESKKQGERFTEMYSKTFRNYPQTLH